MPMTQDPTTGELSSVSYGVDNNALEAGDKSIFDNIGDVVTKGIPLTGLSIVNSFANTGIEVANLFEASSNDKIDKWSVPAELGDGDYTNYYKQHAEGIEGAGLLIGSLIPGMAEVRGLQAAEVGLAAYRAARGGELTNNIARAAGLLPGVRKAEILTDTLSEIKSGGVTGPMTAEMLKGVAFGVADEALKGMAYQMATYATMKGSPLLDNDGFGDVVDFITDGAIVGGAFGGLLEGIGTYYKINKALISAGKAEVDKLSNGELGKGPYIGGDRILSVVQALYDQPLATTDLGKLNAAGTNLAARNTVNGIFLGMTPSGNDTELANMLTSLTVAMKDTLKLDRNEMYDRVSGLVKVARPESPVVPNEGDTSILYVNRFLPRDQLNRDVSINDIISNSPGKPNETEWSLGYRVKDPTYSPRIANFEASVTNADGTQSAPLFTTAKSAFENGYDIALIDGKVFVNPKAPNMIRVARPGESRILTPKEERDYRPTGKLPEGSQPLLGGQVISGATIEDAVRTAPNTFIRAADNTIVTQVPDVISNYGAAPKLVGEGIAYGGRDGIAANTSVQSLSTPITAATPTIDASARHVWASLRGIKPGDTIDPSDISMLEQMYREVTDIKVYPSADAGLAALAKKGVSLGSSEEGEAGEALDTIGQSGLKQLIKEAKDAVIAPLLAAGKLDPYEIGARANVSTDYIAKSMRSDNGLIQPPPTAPQYARLQFNIGSLEQQNGQIARGAVAAQYRIDVIQRALDTAGAATLGPNFLRFKATAKASDADLLGAGPGFVSFARASYGTLGTQMERIGKYVTDAMRDLGRTANDILTPHAMRIRNDPELATELSAYFQALQSTGKKYVQLPEELQGKYFPDATKNEQTVRVLRDSIQYDKNGNALDWDGSHVPDGFVNGSEAGTKGQYSYYTMTKNASEFLDDLRDLNDTRIYKLNKLNSAAGLTKTLTAGTDYAPPIDTSKYPFIAYVREPIGYAAGDGGIGVITSTTAEGLAQKAAAIGDRYEVITKRDIQKFHQAQNDYSSSLNFSQSRVNSDLARTGILNDVLPTTNAESFLKRLVDWNSQQEAGVLRASVETLNAQLFAELRGMGEVQSRFGASKATLASTLLGSRSAAANPYESYVRTALGLSAKEDYSFWSQTQDKVEAFADTAFRVARESFGAASRGIMPYEQASQLMEKFGLGNPYAEGTNTIRAAQSNYYDVANKLPPGKYLTRFLSMANSIMGTLVIKLDPFQQMLHMISTPVMLAGEIASVKNYLSTAIPGTDKMMPATSKVLFDSVSQWFNPATRKADMAYFTARNMIRNPENEYMFSQVLDNIHLPWGGQSLQDSLAKMEGIVGTAQKLSLSNYSETFTSYIAAKSAKTLFGDIGGQNGQELDDSILNFVNRIKGNIVASQRPVAFQGPIGQALGLFQTYQLNLFQNFFRYVGNGEAKSIATLAGLQSTLFGYSSLPGFSLLNNAIVGTASGNPQHKDLYGASYDFFGKKLADWMMYGVASNVLNANFYTRGDINPRSATLLPLNPLDFPAIAGAIHFATDLYDTAGKIAKGGSMPASILQGLEHNGLSRPLQGLAQLMQGYSTTSKGDIVSRVWPSVSQITDSSSMGLSELYTAGVYSRILGARPLDEAVSLDASYRKTQFTANSTAQVERLGEAVKTKLYRNQQPTNDDMDSFMRQYAASGENIKNFSKQMLKWTHDANSSVANQVYKSLQRPGAQNMMQVMGGQQLPDFYNTPAAGGASGSQEADITPAASPTSTPIE